MIKIAALTSGKNSPPSRFRVRQYLAPLKNLGIEVTEYYPLIEKYTTKRVAPLAMLTRVPGLLAARSSAITWFERELLPERFSLERLAGSRRVVDIDDAIWLNKATFSERLARFCDGVIAGNQFIAEHYQKSGARVWIIPTSLDTEKWRPVEGRKNAHWTIGWTGSSSNLKYLYEIEEPLADFLVDNSEARLLIVCNRKPAFRRLPPKRWSFARWTPDNEVALVQTMDVGLMPLADTEWSRGKCALKMIMYMAVGIPSIISPVGFGQELLRRHEIGLVAQGPGGWYESLSRLFADGELACRLGASGRRLTENEFSVSSNVFRLAEVFRTIAAG